MSITPTITEVHERRYEFDLSPEQVQDAIVYACVRAAGLSLPLGVEVEIISDAAFASAGIKFSVPVVADASASQPEPPRSAKLPDPATAAAKEQVAPVGDVPAPVRPRPKTAAKPPRPMAWAGLTSQERSIVLHLEALPDTFSPSDDLTIAQSLTGGIKATEIAPELGITPEEVVSRWKAMWCHAVLEKSRTPTIEGQRRLLAALRYRVETEE